MIGEYMRTIDNDNTKQTTFSEFNNKNVVNAAISGHQLTTIRQYKDNVFCLLYRDKNNLLDLYNGLNDTNYTNVDDLTVTTLKGGVYMKYKNDASFVFGQDLYMFEQQSSRNPNMPLRFLHYLSDVYRQMYNNSDLHRSTMLKIPVPHFVTFYNGKQPLEVESTLRLSDMYEKKMDCPELELIVRVININTGAIINKKSLDNEKNDIINGINQLEAEGVSQGSYVKDFCRVNMKLVPDSFDNKESFTDLNMLFGTARHFEDKTASLAWQPEREYTSGGWGYVGGKAFRARTKRGSQPASNLNIYGTEQDPIFQTQRRGLNSFKADLPDGRYVVYLYWTELSGADVVDLAYQLDNIVQKEKATERLFHVDINGMRVLSSLDVAKEVGVRRPMICKIPVTISAKKGLTVDFIPIKGETMITAIRILKMD